MKEYHGIIILLHHYLFFLISDNPTKISLTAEDHTNVFGIDKLYAVFIWDFSPSETNVYLSIIVFETLRIIFK